MSSPAPQSPVSARWGVGATDPGFDAVESLYRGATSPSGLRAYEPSLRPPEGTHDYSWLYRTDESTTPTSDSAASRPSPLDTASLVTSSGVAVLPAPLVSWSPSALTPARRWPSAALLAVALGCALVLPWAVAAL